MDAEWSKPIVPPTALQKEIYSINSTPTTPITNTIKVINNKLFL